MDPVTALRQIAYYKDRAREDPRRVMAYRNAADVVEALTAEQRAADIPRFERDQIPTEQGGNALGKRSNTVHRSA